MSIKRCDFCEVALVEWMTTKWGGRLPFEFNLVAPNRLPDGVNGWIPGRWTVGRRSMIAMAPATDYPPEIRSAASRVAVVHECQQYLANRAARETARQAVPVTANQSESEMVAA